MDIEMEEINEKTIPAVSTITSNEEFFDALTDDVENSKATDDSRGKVEDEDDFMKKLEEAIGDSETNGKSKDDPVVSEARPEKVLNGDENGAAATEDDLLAEEKDIIDSIINEKLDDDVLKDLECELDTAVENELEELVNSVQDTEDTKDDEPKQPEESTEVSPMETNENPEHKTDKEGTVSSNEESGKETDEMESSNNKMEVDENTSEIKCTENEKIESTSITVQEHSIPESQRSSENVLKEISADPKEKDVVVQESDARDPKKIVEVLTSEDSSESLLMENQPVENEATLSNANETSSQQEVTTSASESSVQITENKDEKKEIDEENEQEDTKMMINEEPTEENEESQDKKSSNEEEVDSTNNDTVKKEDKINERFKQEKEEEEEQEEEEEEAKNLEPVSLNFMKKFAKSLGKLSRTELEDVVLQKITESIVFHSKYTDYRNQCDKKDEIIENLKTKVVTLTKQYNDLEMIHKRIQKDLAERPDQPVTPVKITRAVGLQVYSPHSSSKSKVAGTSQQPTSSFPPQSAMKSTNKRPNETDIHQSEVKKKRPAKIITPMRPPLSEREKMSLDLQEASIEQKLLRKIIPNSNTPSPNVTIRPVTMGRSTAGMTNGTASKPATPTRIAASSQSIDLTDEDDAPVTQPPALVAIHRNAAMVGRSIRPTTPIVRTPDMINQVASFGNRPVAQRHPAPLPAHQPQSVLPGQKRIPPRPSIKISNVQNGIIVSWRVEGLGPEHAKIETYQIYAYEETRSLPATENWKHVGDVKALLLPMAVTLTQFQEGQKYYFAVRAVDIHKRVGPFSMPKTW